MSLKIIALEAENIKKLVAVEIRPDGNLVQITGKNGQGKTSVLDCIWWALAGASHIQATPIRKGENKARIRLDLGEIVVTRVFKAVEGGDVATELKVENADGARFPSPQAMLDDLLGQLCFNPLDFAEMEPRQQFDTLRGFVPGVDFALIDAQNKLDYTRRTDLNRRAKDARTLADKIVVPPGAPVAPVDDSTLVTQLEQAGKHNGEIETRKANRQKLGDDAAAKREEAGRILLEIDDLKKKADALLEEANAMESRLSTAGPLAAPIDTAALVQQIADAKKTNEAAAAWAQKNEHAKNAATLEAEAEKLTKAMADREADTLAKIAAAKLPVEGVTFGEGVILLNGLPFDQASDAEQLRASMSIAMALNPKLRVIRVRDGSRLDEESLAIIAKMAADQDYQIWIERVDSSGKVGFVLENGHVHQMQEAI